MLQKMRKIIVIIFFLIVFVFAGCLVCNHDKVLSTTENRLLATFPELSWNTIKSGKFMNGFETFVNDQLTGRDWFVQLSTKTKIALGQKDINGVIIDSDKLYTKFDILTDDDTKRIEKNMKYLVQFIDNNPNAYFGIIPTAIGINDIQYPNKLNQQEFIVDIYNQIPERTLDIYNILNMKSDEYIYYNTDHHWTSLGAYYTYAGIAQDIGYTPHDKSEYTISEISTNFTGTTQAKLNVNISHDTIDIWQINPENIYERIINNTETYDSIYDMDKLDTSEPYAVFLGGNNGEIVVTNKSIRADRQGTKLLMIKDSFAHSLVPFLLDEYEEITLIDLRYVSMIGIQSLVDTEQYTDIIIMYNIENFVTENKFVLLNR